jgi:type I restriction enzyme S subunit
MNNWRECKLGDIITFQRGYDLPKSSMLMGKYPVVGSNGIIGYHNEYTTEKPSITIGRSGNVGNPFIYDGKSWSHNTSLYIKEYNGCDPYFVFYLLQTLDLGRFANGSAVPTLNRNHIHPLDVSIPPLPAQRAIAEVLSSLDDKIDLLTRQNATLEALAQTYFRQWFVDCEASIPLNNVFDFVNGFAFKGSTYETDGKYRIVTIKNVQDGEVDPRGAAFIKEIPNAMNYKCKLSIGDVLISLTGNVGRVGIVVDNDLLLNQRVAKFQPNDNKLLPYFYFMFRQNDMKVYLESIAKGTAQQNLSPVETLKTLIAFKEEQVYGYVKIADPLFNKIIANKCQIQTLQKLRDTLLPKLISGEVEVKI